MGTRALATLASQCVGFQGTVVVSSEAFSTLSDESAARAIELFRGMFDSIRIVFYLRPQALILRSQYSQQLREGYIDCSFQDFYLHAQKFASFWKFRELCARWQSRLREDELHIRSALRPHLRGGDVVRDFVESFLDVHDLEFPKMQRRNDSLTMGKLHVIRSILLKHEIKSIPFERRRLMLHDFIKKFDWCDLEGDRQLPITRNILEYCRTHFRDDNAYLSTYFGNVDVFDAWYAEQLALEIEDAIGIVTTTQNAYESCAQSASEAWIRFMASKSPSASLLSLRSHAPLRS